MIVSIHWNPWSHVFLVHLPQIRQRCPPLLPRSPPRRSFCKVFLIHVQEIPPLGFYQCRREDPPPPPPSSNLATCCVWVSVGPVNKFALLLSLSTSSAFKFNSICYLVYHALPGSHYSSFVTLNPCFIPFIYC